MQTCTFSRARFPPSHILEPRAPRPDSQRWSRTAQCRGVLSGRCSLPPAFLPVRGYSGGSQGVLRGTQGTQGSAHPLSTLWQGGRPEGVSTPTQTTHRKSGVLQLCGAGGSGKQSCSQSSGHKPDGVSFVSFISVTMTVS